MATAAKALWDSEAAMVADFSAFAEHSGWTVYAETAGWDLLLTRREDGFQIGVEAKLSLNAAVLCQVLEHDRSHANGQGPDCQAVLVPAPKSVNGLETIARRLGIVVIQGSECGHYHYQKWKGPRFAPDLPKLNDHLYYWNDNPWPERCPDQRYSLPDYVPDVTGGKSAPIKLTHWKIAAIKAQIIIETRGSITRTDFRALGMSSSRWTQFWFRSDGEGGFVPNGMPDFKAQHPVNYEQIKADFEKWAPPQQPRQPKLVGAA